MRQKLITRKEINNPEHPLWVGMEASVPNNYQIWEKFDQAKGSPPVPDRMVFILFDWWEY